jgi:Suppressor of fused protein (SUFU)
MNNSISDNIPLSKSLCVKTNAEFNFKIYQCFPKEGGYQLLITDGLSNNLQDVNEDNDDLKHIELYMYLPDYWKLDTMTWPLNWLNRIAELPQKNTTWFGNGDTIPAGNPPEEIDETLKANHFILSRPILLDGILSGGGWKEKHFQMLAVIPIFQREIDYKLRNSHSMLFKKFEKKKITEKLDLYRQSCCRKRLLALS